MSGNANGHNEEAYWAGLGPDDLEVYPDWGHPPDKESVMQEIKLAVTSEELQLIINALEIVAPDSEESCTLRDNLLTSLESKLNEAIPR